MLTTSQILSVNDPNALNKLHVELTLALGRPQGDLARMGDKAESVPDKAARSQT